MRTFGADFQTSLQAVFSRPFWSLVARFPAGTRYLMGPGSVSGNTPSIGGNAHDRIVRSFGALGSVAGRSEKRLDIQTTELLHTNFPALSDAKRISDLFPGNVSNVETDVYLNLARSDGTVDQEIMFKGAIRRPKYNLLEAITPLFPLLEQYLDKQALRKLSSADFPGIREAHIGATAPIIIGSVRQSPGRIVRTGRAIATPTADPANTGTGALLRAIANAPAVDEDWTIRFTDPETVEHTTGDTNQRVGDKITATTRKAFAQSFQTTGTQRLVAVEVRTRATPGRTIEGGFSLAIFPDDANKPQDGFVNSLGLLTPFVNVDVSDAHEWNRATFPEPITVTAATRYWIGVVCVFDTNGDGICQWRYDSAAGYAGGRGYEGTNTFGTGGFQSYTWTSALGTRDFMFRLIFESGGYTASGSVTGADGSGTIDTAFTSASGKVTIPATAWVGTPATGDKFYFSVDTSPAQVILSESPTDTPVKAINQVYWDGDPIGGATISQTTDNEGVNFGRATEAFGVSHAESIPISQPLLTDTVKVKLSKTGSPTEAVVIEVREDSEGLPLGNVLATAVIAASTITGTAVLISATLDRALALAVDVWIVVTSRQASDTDYYTIRRSTTDALAGAEHLSWDKNNQKWVPVASKDLVLEITAATITKETTAVDAAGEPVARVKLDVEIPEDVEVTADVDGWQDDASGTYSGTALTLLRTPDAVIHALLRYAGIPATLIDSGPDSSFEGARASLGSLYAFDGILQDQKTWKEYALQLGFECRCAVDWSVDKVKLRFLPCAGESTIVRILAYADMLGPIPRFEIEQLDPAVNWIDAFYDRAPASGTYRRSVHRDDALSIEQDWGKLEDPDLFQFDFVASEMMAAELAEFYLIRKAWPKRRITAQVLLENIDLEKDDVIGFNLSGTTTSGGFPFTFPFTLGDQFDGLGGGEEFAIEGIQIDFGDGEISPPSVHISAREL